MLKDVVVSRGDTSVRLAEVDPDATGGLTEEQANERLMALRSELRELHDLMMAAESHAVLIMLQGMDAAGKDVTIENVHGAFNPQAARVKAFKSPTEEEAKHHFLWRADLATPMRGEVVTFDRSYYEQALPEELGGDVSGDRLNRRFGHINAFEQILADEDIILVKLLLLVGYETQGKRLEERQAEIGQAWKLSASDWEDRQDWDQYMDAYEQVINNCASGAAPWYVVPANHQWVHNLAVAEILVERMGVHREAWETSRRRIGEQKRREAERARE